MAEIEIPHAMNTFIETDPPRKILHVVTALADKPGSPGFNAEAKHELMSAVGKTQGGRDGLDGYVIHWSAANGPTPKRPKRPADVVSNAVHVMKVLTGEAEDGALADDGKDKAAQEMGRKGGAARAAKMSPERRAEIARRAAAKRWGSE